jgi:hypothetical protein
LLLLCVFGMKMIVFVIYEWYLCESDYDCCIFMENEKEEDMIILYQLMLIKF